MLETYQMRLQRQARERMEEMRRRTRTTRGYGDDFSVANAQPPTDFAPSFSSQDSCSDSSPSSCD